MAQFGYSACSEVSIQAGAVCKSPLPKLCCDTPQCGELPSPRFVISEAHAGHLVTVYSNMHFIMGRRSPPLSNSLERGFSTFFN